MCCFGNFKWRVLVDYAELKFCCVNGRSCITDYSGEHFYSLEVDDDDMDDDDDNEDNDSLLTAVGNIFTV